MRVSTKSFQMQWISNFSSRQIGLNEIQRQVSTGRRIATAADDPAGAAQATLLQQSLDRLDNFGKAADTARRRLSIEESVLDKLTNSLDRARELALQANNGKLDTGSRQAIAAEVAEILDGMVGLANTQDGEGRYLFSGNRVKTQPFTENGGTIMYNGDDGVRFERIGDQRNIAEGHPGSEVFMAIRNGNGTYSIAADPANTGTAYFQNPTVTDPSAWVTDNYTITFTAPDAYEVTDGGGAVVAAGAFARGDTINFNGAAVVIEGDPDAGDSFNVAPSRFQSMFETMSNFVTALENGTELNSTLLDLDRALENVSNTRSVVGSRLSVIEEQGDTNEELTIQLRQTLSSIQDVDLAKAISSLQAQMTSLEAAQKVFAQTAQMSLFRVL
ncbi:MAG: flagellar hook-associated protein FlgL [Gammaproteobacteria bacterium]|nr:flagellar hook-associated protein FlgL [Gammaproteobacteria bacterium]NND37379.1 flagellar hook-associated protein FlgL [Gammaproteobacteria bacterium]